MSLGAYDLAIIRLYREFEDLMLKCLVAAINHDPATFSNHKKRTFPKRMSAAVCEYLICGDGYFDFRGRSGLIAEIRKIGPGGDWLLTIVKGKTYEDSLDRLSALRNFAAHDSALSKKSALKAVGQSRMCPSGEWLKSQKRLENLCSSLKAMAREIEAAVPY